MTTEQVPSKDQVSYLLAKLCWHTCTCQNATAPSVQHGVYCVYEQARASMPTHEPRVCCHDAPEGMHHPRCLNVGSPATRAAQPPPVVDPIAPVAQRMWIEGSDDSNPGWYEYDEIDVSTCQREGFEPLYSRDALRAAQPPSDVRLAIEELKNLVNAQRFDRDHFRNDTEFAEWCLSRARYTLGLIEAWKTKGHPTQTAGSPYPNATQRAGSPYSPSTKGEGHEG